MFSHTFRLITTRFVGLSYLGFVVDDTGSMYNEIVGVKEWITNCVNGEYADCKTAPTGGWLMTSFNDPSTYFRLVCYFIWIEVPTLRFSCIFVVIHMKYYIQVLSIDFLAAYSTQPVIGPTTDVAVIIDAIDKLYAHGGGDCPEYAFTGLLVNTQSR